MGNHGSKGHQFWRYHELMIVVILPAAVERLLFTLVDRSEGPKLHVCRCRPPFLIFSLPGNRMKRNFCI